VLLTCLSHGVPHLIHSCAEDVRAAIFVVLGANRALFLGNALAFSTSCDMQKNIWYTDGFYHAAPRWRKQTTQKRGSQNRGEFAR
jgi:hypothetical protein